MKIALFDTGNHHTPILLEWRTGFQDLGHEATFFPTEKYTVGVLQEMVIKFDIVVFVGYSVHPESLKILKNKYSSTKFICCSDHYDSRFENYKNLVEFYVTTQHECPTVKSLFEQNGMTLYNVPLAGNDHLFYPVKTDEIYDICFIGGLHHGYRGEDIYLYPFLDDPSLNCFLAGMQYKGKGIPSFPYNEANLVRNQSKININFHVDYQKPGLGEPSDRVDLNQSVYNIALTGKLQICDHPLAKDVLEGNVQILTKEMWEEVIYYLLKEKPGQPLLRAMNLGTGREAYKVALDKHTWKVRMQEFLMLYRNHL